MYGGSGIRRGASSRASGSPSPSTVTVNVSPAAVRPPISTSAVVAGDQQLADAQLARRADHRLPRAPIVVERLEQQHLGGATRLAVQSADGPGSPWCR